MAGGRVIHRLARILRAVNAVAGMLTGMEPHLRAHLDQHQGVVSSRAAARLGVTGNDLRALVRDGQLVRVAHGAYVDAELLDPTQPQAHHRQRTRGIVLSRQGRLAASHQSAAVLHGLPVLRKELEIVRAVHTEDKVSTKRYETYTVHPGPGRDGLTTYEGVPTVVPALAVLGTTLVAGMWSGQMAADAALRRGITTTDEMEEWLSRMPRHPGVARARKVVELADPRAESAGESILRLLLIDLGYRVVSQHPVEDASGNVFARVDFYLPQLGVAVEFDGMMKYGVRQGSDGKADARTAKLVLEAERQRERRIWNRGYGVARVVWADLFHVQRIRAEIGSAAGSRRRPA